MNLEFWMLRHRFFWSILTGKMNIKEDISPDLALVQSLLDKIEFGGDFDG